MQNSFKLLIAGVIIEFKSDFSSEAYSPQERIDRGEGRFRSFFYQGTRPADIRIQVYVVKALSHPQSSPLLFKTYHPDNGEENWRLEKCGSGYAYSCPLREKKQYITVNQDLTRVEAFVLAKHRTRLMWDISELIYDFLQVLLISYFAKYKLGIFVHSAAVKDSDGQGFLFTGESGAGKSTISRIWLQHSGALVLNDDRVIITKGKKGFVLHSCPWHGELGLQGLTAADKAPLACLFSLHQAKRNTALKLTAHEAFCLLYPALFVTFWHQTWLDNIVDFARQVAHRADCRSLGFVNDARVVQFIRSVC